MARKTKAEREAEERARIAKQKLEAAKRIEKAPATLFKMMVQAQKLANAGHRVEYQLRATTEPKYQGTPDLPGVSFKFDVDNFRGYNPMGDEYVLNLEAEDWEIEGVQAKLDELQAKEDENERHRQIAMTLKASMTEEEIAAIKKYG